VALAWVSAEQADSPHGRQYADAAAARSEIWHDPVSRAALALVRSRLLRARGELAGAAAAIGQARTVKAPRPLPRWLVSRLGAAEAALLVAQGRPDAAMELSRRTRSAEVPEGMLACGWAGLHNGSAAEAGRTAQRVLQDTKLPLDVRVDALLLTAASELDRSRPAAAKAALARALQLAEPERMRRPFGEATAQLRTMLREHRHRVDGDRRIGTDSGGTDRARARPVPTADVIVQPLTEREQEVLAYLAALLPTEEIADRLYVSVNTVRTHVRSILRKLSAERRNEAVRRAHELGLV